MENVKISIKETSNPTIVKFEADSFLTKNQSFEFDSIDDAAPSPLAQQLFYLPFVKKIYISGNFIAIERYNIVEWSDVQSEVAEQIEKYINSGKNIFIEKALKKKTPVTVYAESTPNPSVMKFVANKKLVNFSHEFKSIDDTKNAPLAEALFHFPFTKSIFLDENFVSITKYDVADWNEITMELREFIRSYVEEGKTVVSLDVEQSVEKENEKRDLNFEAKDDISKEIINILEEYVKPAVASDGGNIEFQSYNAESKTVKVLLQGACSGCPSSTFTLKNGIENMLKEMLNGKVNTVEAING